MTKSKAVLGALLLAGLVATGCATQTSMDHSWIDPNFKGKPIQKVLVIGLAESVGKRRSFETQMSGILTDAKVAAVPSYELLPDLGTVGDEATVKQLLRDAVAKCGADAITVTRLVSAEESQTWVEGSTYSVPAPYYGGMYPYYYNSYAYVSEPGYMAIDKIYVVETNLYDVATEKLVWTGISETVNPSSTTDGIDSIGKLIVRTLTREGLIAGK